MEWIVHKTQENVRLEMQKKTISRNDRTKKFDRLYKKTHWKPSAAE